MSAKYVKLVYASVVGRSLKAVLAYIAHVVRDDAAAEKSGRPARTFYLSEKKIAEKLEMHPKTVQRAFQKLRRSGVLTVKNAGGGRRRFGSSLAGVATTYEFHPEALRPRQTEARTLPKARRLSVLNPPRNEEGCPLDPSTERGGCLLEPSTERGGYIESEDLPGSEDLAGVEDLPGAFRRARVAAPHVVARCLAVHADAFEQKFGKQAHIIRGKDGKLITELVATYGEEGVLALNAEFFASTDPRIVRCDYTVGAFFSLAQHLVIGPRLDSLMAANVDAAARAMGRRRE